MPPFLTKYLIWNYYGCKEFTQQHQLNIPVDANIRNVQIMSTLALCGYGYTYTMSSILETTKIFLSSRNFLQLYSALGFCPALVDDCEMMEPRKMRRQIVYLRVSLQVFMFGHAVPDSEVMNAPFSSHISYQLKQTLSSTRVNNIYSI